MVPKLILGVPGEADDDDDQDYEDEDDMGEVLLIYPCHTLSDTDIAPLL